MVDLAPDAATALDFLEFAFGGTDSAGLIEIAFSGDDGGAINRARLFPNTPEGRGDAARFAADSNARPGVNVYFAPSLRRESAPREHRAKRADVLGSWLLWADFDAPGAAAEATKRWRTLAMPPHRVVVTGRTPQTRAQAFWRAERPFASFDDLDRALAGAHVALGFVGDPKVVNVDRVMRLPGMISWPKPGKEGRVPERTELAIPDHAPDAPIAPDRLAAVFPPRDPVAARKGLDQAPGDLFSAPQGKTEKTVSPPGAPVATKPVTPATDNASAQDAGTGGFGAAAQPHEPQRDMIGRRIDGRDEYAMQVIAGAIRGLAARLLRWPTPEELAVEAWPTYERGVGPKNPASTLDAEGRGWPWFLDKCGVHARRAAAGQIRGLESIERCVEAVAMNGAGALSGAGGAFGAAAGAIPAPTPAVTIPAVPRFTPVSIRIGGAGIPRRSWLYGRHYVRSFVSVTVSPGGVGKSSLTIVEALAMATGRGLLGERPATPLRVWLWNGEDPLDETLRRIAAACLHYGIAPQEIEGRLFADSGRDTPIVLASQMRDGVMMHGHVVDSIVAHAKANAIDVVILDPFVSVHAVSENDNSGIDAVMKRGLAPIAERAGVAVECVHHSRKPPSGPHAVETTVDDARGAGALIAAARSARTINRMSKQDAERFGVEPEERWRFFRVDSGKSNMSPPAERAVWRRMESVTLDNGGPMEPGDSVGVATPWTPPDAFDEITVSHLETIILRAEKGFYLEDVRSPTWIGHLIGEVAGFETRSKQGAARAQKVFETWVASGALGITERRDQHRNLRRTVCRGLGAAE